VPNTLKKSDRVGNPSCGQTATFFEVSILVAETEEDRGLVPIDIDVVATETEIVAFLSEIRVSNLKST
jgi:hypothetical protein